MKMLVLKRLLMFNLLSAFFFFMEGKERKVRFLGHKCPRFEKVRETQFPKC